MSQNTLSFFRRGRSRIVPGFVAALLLVSFLFPLGGAVLASPNEGRGLNVQGRALGGKIRSGPSLGHRQSGSASEGTYLTILQNAGQRLDGYDWFEIVLDNGLRGFVWGGILCSNGPRVEGLYASCDTVGQQTGAAVISGNGGGWMAFATGSGGQWGHGAGPSLQDAQRFAMNYCGHSSCRLQHETQAKCHALAKAPGGFWFGSAPTQAVADDRAVDACLRQGGNGCRIEYRYCQ